MNSDLQCKCLWYLIACNSYFIQMELPSLASGFWMLICFYVSVNGYPNGRVREACMSMIPCHGSSPQPSPVHIIAVNWTEFKPGDTIEGIVFVIMEEFNLLFLCVAACIYLGSYSRSI